MGDEQVPHNGEPLRNPAPVNVEAEASDGEERSSNRARMHEVVDEEWGGHAKFRRDYDAAGRICGNAATVFESLREAKAERGESPWAPFEDEEEWELARWLMQNVGQNQTDTFLKLPIVRLPCINHHVNQFN